MPSLRMRTSDPEQPKNEPLFKGTRRFAKTVTLTNGVPLESFGKMLGYKSIKSTQHYAKALDKR